MGVGLICLLRQKWRDSALHCLCDAKLKVGCLNPPPPPFKKKQQLIQWEVLVLDWDWHHLGQLTMLSHWIWPAVLFIVAFLFFFFFSFCSFFSFLSFFFFLFLLLEVVRTWLKISYINLKLQLFWALCPLPPPPQLSPFPPNFLRSADPWPDLTFVSWLSWLLLSFQDFQKFQLVLLGVSVVQFSPATSWVTGVTWGMIRQRSFSSLFCRRAPHKTLPNTCLQVCHTCVLGCFMICTGTQVGGGFSSTCAWNFP